MWKDNPATSLHIIFNPEYRLHLFWRSFDERIKKLKEIQRGWVNYFRMGSIRAKLKEVNIWLRNRLRYCIWTDWKKLERKRKNLIRLGISEGQAYAWSRTRMGGWAVAQSPILVTTITLKRLVKRGYESMLDYYKRVSLQLNEPLYTRPAWPVLRNEGYSGHAYAWLRQTNVRGEPRQLQLARPSTRLWAVGFPQYSSFVLSI